MNAELIRLIARLLDLAEDTGPGPAAMATGPRLLAPPAGRASSGTRHVALLGYN
jgi:hypothetical protein